MNPLRIVIDRKVLIGMFFIAITMLGYFSYQRLSMEIYPNSELPTIIVSVSARTETTPAYLEREAILPLEGAIGRLEGVEEIETTVNQRRGTITVTYSADVNMKYANLKIEEAVETVRSSFEDEDEFTVNVQKVDTERLVNVFMGLQVRGSGGLERVRAIIDDKITPELEAVNGVASVSVTGGRTKSVEITLNDEACEAAGITASTVTSLLGNNTGDKTFIGEVWDGNRRYFANLTADYTDIRDIENLVVKPAGPIHLKDIATVTFGTKEATSISRVNGKDAVTIQLTRDSQANLIDLAKNVRSVVEKANTELAGNDIEIAIQTDTAKDMEENLTLIKELALSGALLAMAVLWLFLRNFRLVTVIVLAIPISVLAAFNFFYAFGITINTLTLVGVALAVGMLLDNGVVVLENIMRLLSLHRSRDAAVLQGTSEVWRSIAASTITTIIVFLPFVFASNYAIRLIGSHVGISIISTLLISLLTALFLTPMLVHTLLRGKRDDEGTFARTSYRERPLQIYILLLKSAMRYPARTILGAVGAFLFTLVLAVSLSINISREVQLTDFPVYLTAPTGSTLETSDKLTAELETRLMDIPEKQDVISRITSDGAQVTIRLREDYEKVGKRTIPQIKADIEKRIDRFNGATVSLSEPRSGTYSGAGGGGSSSGTGLEQAFGIGQQRERILIKGNDSELIRTVANNLRYYIEQLETVSSVGLNVSDNSPEVHIVFDRDRMAGEDISLSTVSRSLSSFGREVSTSVPFKQGTEEYDITIKNSSDAEKDEEDDKTADDLRELQVTTDDGAAYDLGQLSTLVFTRGQASVHRLNQERQVEVTYRFEDEVNESKPALEEARNQIDQLVAGLSIPAGVAVEVKHTENDTGEFYFLIGAAFTIIYMVLASVFESFSAPFVMMFTIPLAGIGALGALVLTGNSLMNASSLLGFLILLGVVVNNGILLIDYTRILRTRGFRRERALMTAGRARLRPILITSITTIIGMLPLAMGKSEYVSMIGAPFAIAVVGGLSMSTLFTLVLIPTVYSGMETAFAWFRGLDWKLKAAQAVTLAVVALLINATAESTLWKFVYWTVSLALVPAVFAFLTVSLRRAETEAIPRNDTLNLHIQRVVKTYDADGRFVREWKKGARLDATSGKGKYQPDRDIGLIAWVAPLLAFFIYFTFFYLTNGLWIFIFAHAVYISALSLWKFAGRYLVHRVGKIGKVSLDGVFRRGMTVLVWGLPAVGLAGFHFREFGTAPLAFIAIIWYGALTVRAASNRYHAGGFNLARLTGRFANLRKTYYEAILSIPVLGRRKQPFQALDGVSLEITSGMFGLLGPNGAGKTTIMRIICGILDQSMGTMRINGVDFRDRREELQGLIGYLPQEFGTYENLTAREFLDYIAILKGIHDLDRRREIVNQVLTGVHLADNGDQKIGSFSGGMKQRVGIAMTLLHLPRILVVDEPTAGLDPRERIRFRNLLVELSRERIVIFSTHIIEDISSSCNRVAVLNRGHLSYLGSPLEMTEAVRGKVWEIRTDDKTFAGMRDTLRIVHHMRVGDRIRVRCLSKTPPVPEAEQATPTLEDAYLWLLGEHKKPSGVTTTPEPGMAS